MHAEGFRDAHLVGLVTMPNLTHRVYGTNPSRIPLQRARVHQGSEPEGTDTELERVFRERYLG